MNGISSPDNSREFTPGQPGRPGSVSLPGHKYPQVRHGTGEREGHIKMSRVVFETEEIVHIRRTREEPDSISALADAYCGKSPYWVDRTITYGRADELHFEPNSPIGELCPQCIDAINRERKD